MRKRTILFLAVLVVLAALCPLILMAGSIPATGDDSLKCKSGSSASAFLRSGSIAEAASAPTFYIGETPFRFLGGFVPGWHWGDEYWSMPADDDLMASARSTGITVMHLMLPQFERPLGVWDEARLQRLDHMLDSAYRNNIYVMVSFIQAYSETSLQGDSPYYYVRGIEGLIKDSVLHDGFKNRIAKLVNRQNTVNGRWYKDDPVILAWIICDEPISAPFNYPSGGFPQVTVDELAGWFKEMSDYIKGMDPNHLVSVYAQPAIQAFFGGTPETRNEYQKTLGIPELDFVYMEDAGLDVITNCDGYTCCPHDATFNNEQFQMGKPVVFLPAFTSGCWDKTAICHDYTLQANDLDLAIPKYFEMGATAAVVQNWGTDLYPFLPEFDQCYVYTDTNTTVTQKLLARSQAVNPNGYPNAPLQFVTVPAVVPGYTLTVVNSGGGTVTSSPSGINCGVTCSSTFLQGTTVTLTAVAEDDFNFTSWSGCASTNSTVCTVGITGTTTVTASFTHKAPPGPAPVITTLSPTSGAAGATVTISGKYFGATQSSSTVKFNGVTASIISTWSDTRIACKVPVGAATGPVVVHTDAGGDSAGKPFTVKAPLVGGVSPSSGAIGMTVNISGSSFGTTQGLSTVTFGGVQASVITWTNTKITCTVPGSISAGPGPVSVPVVVTVGAQSSPVKTFTVKPPLISGVSPSSGAVGMTVNISGNYFGPSQGSSTVTFNGATVSPNTWTNTKITCTVPAGTKTGPVVVTTEAGSNAVVKTFTIKAPLLSGISPLHGQIQDTVTLSGNYFGVIQGESKVMFPNDKEGDITSWSNTKITCKVPFGTWTGPVTVTTDGGTSKEKWFTVDPPPP